MSSEHKTLYRPPPRAHTHAGSPRPPWREMALLALASTPQRLTRPRRPSWSWRYCMGSAFAGRRLIAWRLCLAPDAWHLSELPCDSACPFRSSPDPQPDNPSLCVPLWAGSSHIRKLKRERTAANVDNMNRLPARSINNSCIHLTAAWPACTSPWLGSHVMHDGRGATPAGFRSCRPPLPRGSSRSELRA